jgi:hypothetical protein
MDRYNFRTTSLNNDQLTVELAKRGAKTFGSVRRKQQRLQRFIDAETKREQARQNLRIVIENEQRKVIERAQTRSQELRRSSRLASLLSQYLGY